MSVAAASPSHTSSHRAAGSSFYTAMKILPRPQREAMFEIYGFCRRVDDIADSDRPRAERLIELAAWRADVNALYAGKTPPRLAGLAQPVHDFDLAREDFLALIDGMEMDAFDDIRGPSAAILDLYCDRVASAVGRLSVRVFGVERKAGLALAQGIARQQEGDEPARQRLDDGDLHGETKIRDGGRERGALVEQHAGAPRQAA